MESLKPTDRDILTPTDPNDYKIIDTFNRASGDLNADPLTYGGLWSTSGTVAYKTDAAGFVTTSVSDPDQVMSANLGVRPSRVNFIGTLVANGRFRILMRKTISNVDQNAATMDCIIVLIRESANLIDWRVTIVRQGVAEEIVPWTNTGATGAGVHSITVEDTGTDIILDVSGTQNSVTLANPTEFEANTLVGFTIKSIDADKIQKLRAF